MARSIALLAALATASAATPEATTAFRLILDEAAARDGAVCLDGSPAVVYISLGTEPTKFYVHQQGGGWCNDLDGCAARAFTALGSSKRCACA